MTIIPAIDIMDGKVVRLAKGDYARQTIYSDDPFEVAKQFEATGLKRLHLVDLDGARAGKVQNWDVLAKIAAQTNLKIDFSGGIRTEDDIEKALGLGASYITIGTMAFKSELTVSDWLIKYGVERFIIGADVNDGFIAVNGWTEVRKAKVLDFISRYKVKGVEQFICTDIAKDGMLEGPCTDLYREILESHPGIELIASGGVSSINDISSLEKVGCSAVVVGKAIYENRIKLEELC